jgi:hypothetical protein
LMTFRAALPWRALTAMWALPQTVDVATSYLNVQRASCALCPEFAQALRQRSRLRVPLIPSDFKCSGHAPKKQLDLRTVVTFTRGALTWEKIAVDIQAS